jgi:thiopeptide-type bacteriocin biosynthesis protein
MPLVEQLFYYDSQCALKLISKKGDINKLYATALLFMQEMINICVPGINDQIALARIIADSFSHEFDVKQDGFKKLNQGYQEFKAGFNVSETAGQLSSKYKKAFIKVMDSCESENQRNKLLADLLHMHINRLFNSDQRTHELILYHYLLKMLVTQRACTIAQQV